MYKVILHLIRWIKQEFKKGKLKLLLMKNSFKYWKQLLLRYVSKIVTRIISFKQIHISLQPYLTHTIDDGNTGRKDDKTSDKYGKELQDIVFRYFHRFVCRFV